MFSHFRGRVLTKDQAEPRKNVRIDTSITKTINEKWKNYLNSVVITLKYSRTTFIHFPQTSRHFFTFFIRFPLLSNHNYTLDCTWHRTTTRNSHASTRSYIFILILINCDRERFPVLNVGSAPRQHFLFV